MSATTSSALIIPAKVSGKLKPPASKKEIIEALARRKLQNRRAEEAKATAQVVAARHELNRLCRAHALAQPIESLIPEGANFSIYQEGGGMLRFAGTSEYVYTGRVRSITISVRNVDIPAAMFTPEMKKQAAIIEKIAASGLLVPAEFKNVLREVRDQMSGQNTDQNSRIKALLSDPETVKLLDKTLNRLDEATNKSIAA